MNINGDDGPKLISVFTCKNCRFLGEAALGYGKFPYKCFHTEVITYKSNIISQLNGDIGLDKITPNFCPLLTKKLRKAKLNFLKR